jgi:secretion/DNA translocation related TadE-like protein
VWTVGGIGVVAVALTGLLWFAAAVSTRHRAQSAADLAALAAAAKAVAGEERACADARWVADQMRVALSSCRLSGWDALVEVAAAPPVELVPFGSAAARARAGPVGRDR